LRGSQQKIVQTGDNSARNIQFSSDFMRLGRQVCTICSGNPGAKVEQNPRKQDAYF